MPEARSKAPARPCRLWPSDDDGQDDDCDDDDGADDDGDFRFAIDGLTEKLHMFPCRKESEALAIIKKHLPFVCIIVYLSSRYDCII